MFNNYVEELGYDRYPDDIRIPQTQLLTVYAYPEELNNSLIQLMPDWFNLEAFNKNAAIKQDLINLIKDRYKKDDVKSKSLIYLSMGTMGSADTDLMNRLVQVLARTRHNYLVSMGTKWSNDDKMPSNIWGKNYWPQTGILPLVDLVITHGGNNTVTECFAHGKPMVVLPLFADQFDNAQRLQETGFGVRLDPYDFKDEELIDAIDQQLLFNKKDFNVNDNNNGNYQQQQALKLQQASKRILVTDKHTELYELIESKIK